jgi:hypothetical protein
MRQRTSLAVRPRVFEQTDDLLSGETALPGTAVRYPRRRRAHQEDRGKWPSGNRLSQFAAPELWLPPTTPLGTGKACFACITPRRRIMLDVAKNQLRHCWAGECVTRPSGTRRTMAKPRPARLCAICEGNVSPALHRQTCKDNVSPPGALEALLPPYPIAARVTAIRRSRVNAVHCSGGGELEP